MLYFEDYLYMILNKIVQLKKSEKIIIYDKMII